MSRQTDDVTDGVCIREWRNGHEVELLPEGLASALEDPETLVWVDLADAPPEVLARLAE